MITEDLRALSFSEFSILTKETGGLHITNAVLGLSLKKIGSREYTLHKEIQYTLNASNFRSWNNSHWY